MEKLKDQELIKKVKDVFIHHRAYVKRRAEGKLKYDYIVPGGPSYPEHWDWDGFFTGMALAADISAEGIFLRNWALNFLLNAKKSGRVAGCLTPKGWDPRLYQMKPFLAQGSYFSSRFIKDYSWIEPYWDKFLAVVTFREKNLWNKKYDLGVWYNWIVSGADNNVALIQYPEKSVVATDVNTFVYREYKSVSKIAKALGKKKDQKYFDNRSEQIKRSINKHLWCEKEKMYCNIYVKTDEHIKRATYSTFIPLWGGLADKKKAKQSIQKYLLSDKHMNSPFGMRTLSKSDPAYNNVDIIKPYSNWQGPIWPHVNYLYMHAMLHYGFRAEALKLARKVSWLLVRGIEKTGTTHENYHGDTGEPLTAPYMVGWNLLVANMLEEAVNRKNPFRI